MSKEVKREVKKKRKLNVQKIFNLVSFTFILACCIFYGSRFIKFYIENNKTEEIKTLADNIINNNKNSDNFKSINGSYYFTGNAEKNYLTYSNLIWRIIRINNDESITLTADNSLTALASGENQNFENSYLYKWLNDNDEDYTGILQNSLNNPSQYLTFTNTCKDNIEDTGNISCKETTDEIYITTPSINDYVNTGSSDSFMNNEENFYLINNNSNDRVWYVDNEGKISTSNGTDIIGVKPVITIKSTISEIEGDGTKENPYIIEDERGLFGSYVKLGNDIWRIYQVDGDNIKLSLDSYLKINDQEVTYKYSNNGYYHNDTTRDTLAYYLKNTYLSQLSYNDYVNEVEYSNGIYGSNNDYDYSKTLSQTVPTKATVLSIGDIFLNPVATNYYTSTGISTESNLVYVMQNDFRLYTKIATSDLKIIPVISIRKDILTKGNGSIDSPYEVQ